MRPTETMKTPGATKAGSFISGDDTHWGGSLQDPDWRSERVSQVYFLLHRLLNLDRS